MTRKTVIRYQFPKVRQEHGLLWRAQEGALLFNSVPGARPLMVMESPRELYHSIQFKRCARSTAFHGEPKGALPFNSVPGARPLMVMESPRELFLSIPKVCQEHGLLWRAQGSSTIPFNPKGVPGARPSFHDDHHGISQNPFGIVICLYVCVF